MNKKHVQSKNWRKLLQVKELQDRTLLAAKKLSFTAEEWNAKSEKEQQEILMNYRIAYLGETMVNWCAELGTVLANDEVVDGVSERGGYPVIQKKMRQWCSACIRIRTTPAGRVLGHYRLD